MNDRFYQAAYDRSLVLLRLGRGDDALGSYLRAERWASPPLPQRQRQAFLGGLETEENLEGNALVAGAARSAMAR